MSPDLVNGCWELAGAAIVVVTIRKLLQERRVAGTRWYLPLFFWSWCAWNLYYYPALSQPWSTLGAFCMFLANGTYAWLLFWYGPWMRMRRYRRRHEAPGPLPPVHFNCRCVAVPVAGTASPQRQEHPTDLPLDGL